RGGPRPRRGPPSRPEPPARQPPPGPSRNTTTPAGGPRRTVTSVAAISCTESGEGLIECLFQDAPADGHRARRPSDLAIDDRPGRAEGADAAPPIRVPCVPGRRQRARPAARTPPERLRHRNLRASARSQEALPKLLDHRAALPAGA